MTQINSVEQLKELALDGLDCFISFGALRSSKFITYHPEENIFEVYHDIDRELEELTEEELLSMNIGEAMKTGNFYSHDFGEGK